MYNGYKVVCVTPAGRRRYMKILVPYILSSPIVDEYQIWANTLDQEDLAFFRRIAKSDPRVVVIDPPEQAIDGVNSIGQFFRYCIDEKSVYIRFDDDVVFLSEYFFEELVKFRIDNPQYFYVAPTIVNNALCGYILQARFPELREYGNLWPYAMDRLGWSDPKYAQIAHTLFLYKHASGALHEWFFDKQELAVCRFSINCISWLGREFATFGGIVPSTPDTDEEEWISARKPTSLGMINAICGRAIASHFAFRLQREHLDTTNLLDQYEELCIKACGPNVEKFSGGLIRADLKKTGSAG